MRNYRLGYDFVFVSKDPFLFKGEWVGGISLDLLFKIFDAEGNETFFETSADDLKEQKIVSLENESYYLWELVTVSFDKENLFSIHPNNALLEKFSENFSWEVESYWVDLGQVVLEPKQISKAEFLDLLGQNKSLFDNSDNEATQTISYFTQEVPDEPQTVDVAQLKETEELI